MKYALIVIAIITLFLSNFTGVFGHASHNIYIFWFALILNIYAAKGLYPTIASMLAVPLLVQIPIIATNTNFGWVVSPSLHSQHHPGWYTIISLLLIAMPYTIFLGNVIAQFTGKVRVRRA